MSLDYYAFYVRDKKRKKLLEIDTLNDIPKFSQKYPEDYIVKDFVKEDKEDKDENKYETKINFDEASQAWRQNKTNKTKNSSSFEYRCGFIKKDKTPCKGIPYVQTKSYMKEHKLTTKEWSPCRQHKNLKLS